MVDECVIERDRRREKKNASSSACTDLNEAGLFTPNTRWVNNLYIWNIHWNCIFIPAQAILFFCVAAARAWNVYNKINKPLNRYKCNSNRNDILRHRNKIKHAHQTINAIAFRLRAQHAYTRINNSSSSTQRTQYIEYIVLCVCTTTIKSTQNPNWVLTFWTLSHAFPIDTQHMRSVV